MPYKDIKNRREAWKRWKEKHKTERAELVRIQKLSVYANPVRKKCSIEGCNELGERHHPDYQKPKEIIWLCKLHHESIHTKPSCTVDGCSNKHLARGFCQKHYSRWRRS